MLLALPASSDFVELHPITRSVPLLDGGIFREHTVLRIPCESRANVMEAVHRFELAPSLSCAGLERTGVVSSAELNRCLEVWALDKARRAVRSSLGAGPNSDAGVQVSNRGGYQSPRGIFSSDGGEAPFLRALHIIACAAMDNLGAECCPAAGWRPGSLQAADAWVNVNGVGQYNVMHQHDAGCWSAVYFVSEGTPCLPADDDLSGHLVLRAGGTRRRARGDGARLDASEWALHSFMAVPPKPGTLWLFPGGIPHAVMASRTSRGGGAEEPARVSIALNFNDSRVPRPLDAEGDERRDEADAADVLDTVD